MSIEVNAPELRGLIDENAVVDRICTGFKFTEGPIWNAREQRLYFSDMPGDIRRRWSEKGGVAEVRNPSNKCNGMTYDAAGNLYVCEHATSKLVMETAAGERRILASHWQGRELNSPNDVVLRSERMIYFSDPIYGRVRVFGVERSQELNFQGVFRVSPDGKLHLESDDFEAPNGLCFSPDEKSLYVNDSARAHIRVFPVGSDGSLIHFFSTNLTLRPGMVISTGTPGGTGWASDPELGGVSYKRDDIVRPAGYLAAGDVIASSIEGNGTLENRVQVLE